MDQVALRFVSPIVSLLIQNLVPLALSFIPSGGIDGKLKQWTNMLVLIQAVLEDAEDRQLEEKPIQLWLFDVQKMAFEIEDFIDDLTSEARRLKIIAAPESNRSGRLRKFISRFSPTAIRFSYDMDRKIGEISNSLQELEKRKNMLHLQMCIGGKYERTGDQKLPLAPSLVDPTLIYGREVDSAVILKLLLQDGTKGQDGKLRIISIVGMGGIGKTTLAQSLYRNLEVKGCFHDRIWVRVTKNFDVFKISKIIYEEVSDESCTFSELNKVQEKLMEKLSKKKFLLVLDDVWNEEFAEWDLLRAPFHGGIPGSTIIVTTRYQNVAKIMGSKEVYDLKVLSDGDCLSVLAQHAFERPNFDLNPEFKEVGEVIAKRCQGLPLAAKSLGGLLRTRENLEQWTEVSTSKIWELQRNGIIPALWLSYHHLPPYLKPLFAYCSIFPKAHEFDKQELILLWMAQGFLRKSGQKQMEEMGCEYFNELLSRSFFQCSTRNESRFLMHDLNNDLAQFVAGLICLRLDSEMESNVQYKVSEETQHASFISHKYDDFKKIKALNEGWCLRTILPIREKSLGISYISNLLLKEFPRLPCLRVLSLNGYCVNELPKSIANLNHLRYLDLSGTNIKVLPKSICEFSNLQTLLLHGCSELVQLPARIQKLTNLRHLDIVDTPSLKEMPFGIGLLTHLRTLSKFIVDKSKGRKLLELKSLHYLEGTISINGMENVMSVKDSIEANLLGKKGLQGLEMKWSSSSSSSSSDSGLEYKVLYAMKPHLRLASLSIEFYGGDKFPGWVGDQLFSDMVKLRLVGCRNCANLPPLGQLTSLKELFIQGMDGVKIVGPEFFGTGSLDIVSFQSLITLSFMDMGSWEEWCADSINGAFPCLQQLRMFECRKLNKVSFVKIPSLESLEINGCSEKVLRSVAGVSSVKKLAVFDISELTKLDEEIILCLSEVEVLNVSGCKQLTCLWEEEVARQVLEKMRSLSVKGCNEVESLGDKDQMLPRSLESLDLFKCDKLNKMPNWQNSFMSLKRLRIWNCKNLQDNLTSTTALETEIGGYDFSNLELVSIERCPSMKWFPTGKTLPTTLRYLYVDSCENMEEVSQNGMSLPVLESVYFLNWSNLKSLSGGLVHLTRLYIIGCLSIESIPEKSLPPTLISLVISECKNLKYMLCANEMKSLTSLRTLEIVYCENLEGYPSGGCWPPNIVYLRMGDVKRQTKEWGLASLPTSLLKLIFQGKFPQLVSFTEVGTQLPSSLARLQIMSLNNLESLGQGLENLSSLQHLQVCICPKVRELPETLLPTLSSLVINECPVLRERCKKEKRDYWSKISHIPCVEIN